MFAILALVMSQHLAPPARATVAELRARLAAMGGLADASRLAQPRRRPPLQRPSAAARATALDFAVEAFGPSSAVVRRVSMDLRPFLDRAGAVEAAPPTGLVSLLSMLPAQGGARLTETQVAILDIETIGLRGSGVVPFLVGIARTVGSRLDIEQYLLADPDAEAEMLDSVIDRLAGCVVLVTYNGRSFDIPVLQSRCVINRRPAEAVTPTIHCDLLGPVRRLFRERLSVCTLRQAEVGLLGMDRGEDVPGYEAAGRYRAWLGGAPPALLEGVVRHNQFDLCATAVLAARLVRHVAGDLVRPVHPADRYCLGVHLERLGLGEAAEEHLWSAFHQGATPWSRHAGHRIARRRRRAGAPEAATVWGELLRRQPGDLAAARGLAIALERCGDALGALAVCDTAEMELAGRSAWRRRISAAGIGGDRLTEEWRRRRARLQRRISGRRAASPGRRPGPTQAEPA